MDGSWASAKRLSSKLCPRDDLRFAKETIDNPHERNKKRREMIDLSSATRVQLVYSYMIIYNLHCSCLLRIICYTNLLLLSCPITQLTLSYIQHIYSHCVSNFFSWFGKTKQSQNVSETNFPHCEGKHRSHVDSTEPLQLVLRGRGVENY